MTDNLPPHVWFVRAHKGFSGAGYYPARAIGWAIVGLSALFFILVGVGVAALCVFQRERPLIWIVCGAIAIAGGAAWLNRLMARHADLSITWTEIKARRRVGA